MNNEEQEPVNKLKIRAVVTPPVEPDPEIKPEEPMSEELKSVEQKVVAPEAKPKAMIERSIMDFFMSSGEKKEKKRVAPGGKGAEAHNLAHAAAVLKKQLKMTNDEKKREIKAKADKSKKTLPFSFSSFFMSFSVKEQTHFAKRLSFLIRSGVPVLESMYVLRRQTKSRGRGAVLDSIINDISNGQFLYASLGRFNNLFGSFAVNVVRVGEMSGSLSHNLVYLAEELKKRYILRRKIIGALVYPAFITVATLGISVLLTVYIFPKIMPIFIGLNVHLPFTTRALLFVSNFLQSYGIYLLIVLVLGAVGFTILARKVPVVHYYTARTILRLPIVGNLIQSYNMANFCRSYSLLLKSGFNVIEATDVTRDSTANPVYKKECEHIQSFIIRGERISKHLEASNKLFPDMVSHMIMIGETSGNLSDTLMYLSEHYEAELDDLIRNLSSSIEPVLMVFMGLIVGFVAVSVITPIYEITQNLSQ